MYNGVPLVQLCHYLNTHPKNFLVLPSPSALTFAFTDSTELCNGRDSNLYSSIKKEINTWCQYWYIITSFPGAHKVQRVAQPIYLCKCVLTGTWKERKQRALFSPLHYLTNPFYFTSIEYQIKQIVHQGSNLIGQQKTCFEIFLTMSP